MAELLTIESLIALLTLSVLEIVLGIDNIIFISILSNKLPEEKQRRARNIGLFLAMILRLGLLSLISVITQMENDLFEIAGYGFSGRDLILLAGGLFLIAKSTSELGHKLKPKEHQEEQKNRAGATIGKVLIQIILLDLVFSLDSILTAIGLTDQVILMMIAVVISVGVMMLFSGAISRFINNHPTLQVLALAFLILIGFTLTLEVKAFSIHIPKGYIYFAVAFSLLVEFVNIKIRKPKDGKKNIA